MIYEMTRKRLGAACIVDDDQKFVGVFTDGDLRRSLERGVDFASTTAGDVAVQNPKTIEAQALVTRAINVMETYNIMVLPVLDKQGKLVGITHLHDILKAGFGK